MPIFNSKQAGMVFLSQRIVSFYNETVLDGDSTFSFYQNYDDTNPKYTLDVSALAGKNRCLQYKNFITNAYSQTVCPYALYIDASGGCNVLFETNFVQCQQNNDSVMCTFWSTLTTGKSCKLQAGSDVYYQYGKVFSSSGQQYYYKYDVANIYHVNVKNMLTFQLQQSYKNIFCAVKVDIQPMYVTSSANTTKIIQDVAIIKSLPIVLQQVQSNSPVFDFSLQGAGGGIKQHNHIPHIDGTGFAFAVFHPGTTMPQLAWSSV